MSDPDEFLRTDDIAELLKVSRKTVERLYSSGAIRRRHLSARCAGAMRKDVIAYLETR
jgi:Mn-dependent DtxR family transcriptional regulator